MDDEFVVASATAPVGTAPTYDFNTVQVGVTMAQEDDFDPANDDARYGPVPLEMSHGYESTASKNAPKKTCFKKCFLKIPHL